MPSSRTSSLLTPDARRRRLIGLLFAWCLATGAPWDLVQVFAWGRMWTGHLQTQSASAALAATFSPEGLCGVCEVVQSAKQRSGEAEATPFATLLGKVLLLPALTEGVALAPDTASAPHRWSWLAGDTGLARAAPPVPPPRRNLA